MARGCTTALGDADSLRPCRSGRPGRWSRILLANPRGRLVSVGLPPAAMASASGTACPARGLRIASCWQPPRRYRRPTPERYRSSFRERFDKLSFRLRAGFSVRFRSIRSAGETFAYFASTGAPSTWRPWRRISLIERGSSYRRLRVDASRRVPAGRRIAWFSQRPRDPRGVRRLLRD